MARYTGPVCRLCRREGMKLFLKGRRCYSPKCPLGRERGLRSGPPGLHAAMGPRGREKDYALRLRAKQRAKRIYGVLERQFQRYFEEASRQKGVTGEVLAQLLERRLDNVVYRLGFGASRRMARQLVLHRHILVNGRIVNVPSYQVRMGDVVELRERARKIPGVLESTEAAYARGIPAWLSLDLENLRGQVKALPTLADADPSLDVQMIVEFYSR